MMNNDWALLLDEAAYAVNLMDAIAEGILTERPSTAFLLSQSVKALREAIARVRANP